MAVGPVAESMISRSGDVREALKRGETGVDFTTDMIAAAERVLGVCYTDSERRLMVGNLAPQVEKAQQRRSLVFPNNLAPALRFDPRPPGFRAPAPQLPVRWSEDGPDSLPGDEESIAFAPVAHLSRWLRRGVLSSTRLTEIYLTRIEAHADQLECYVSVAAEQARAEARAMDALLLAGTYLGPLHGIPYALKDLFDARGLSVTWGGEPWADRIAESDAAVVDRLRRAGAVLLGKSSVGAVAYGDIWLGRKTRNPWNRDEGSSGSSAGSASATAAGLCGFAIGTETLGSITLPSERCGATGLRPTFGRVPRTGCMALCWSLDKVGPICRSVEDAAMVLEAINGGDSRDPGSIDQPFNHDALAPIDGIRIGYLPSAYEEDAVTELDRQVLREVRNLGLKVSEVTLPDLPYASLVATLYAEAAASFEQLTLSGDDDSLTRQDEGAWPNAFRKARFLSAVDHVQLDRLRRRVMDAVDSLFNEIDVLVGPVSTGPMLVASNFTGHPALVLRAGFDHVPTRSELSLAKAKLELGEARGTGPVREVPRGLCLWSGLFEESALIRVGKVLEGALGVADRRPSLDSP